MNLKKIFRRTILAVLSIIFLLSAAVGATVKLYTATGEDYANEIESQDIAKLRARDKAIKNATKQAGVYLKTYSRSVNSELTDDEVTAITSNAWQLVGEPKFNKSIKQISDETTIIVWTATVEVNVDDSEIQNWIKRDDKDKSTIISKTNDAIKALEENDKKIEDLREKYNRATSQAEKNNINKQINDADRDFLANQKLEEGLKLYYAQNYNGAIKFYNEALEFGEYAEVYTNRGICYLDLGQKENAIKDFDKAITLDSNLTETYYNRGVAYMDGLKQYERAIQDYSKAIKLKPNFALAYNNRGACYIHLGQYERAIQDFNKAIAFYPNYAEAYTNRGIVYFDLGQYERAVKNYDKAISINPNYTNAYVSRGNVYGQLGKYEQAIQNYDKAISIDKNDDNAYYNRGLAYDYLGQYERAIKNYDEAISINPNYLLAYYNRGIVYGRHLKKYDVAIRDFNKVIDLNPNYTNAYINRAMCYKLLGEAEKSKADFAKAKQLGYKG